MKRGACGSFRARCGSEGCGVAQLGCGVSQVRVRCGSVRVRCGSLGCGVVQIVAHRLAVRQARVRIPARHPWRRPSTERMQ